MYEPSVSVCKDKISLMSTFSGFVKLIILSKGYRTIPAIFVSDFSSCDVLEW